MNVAVVILNWNGRNLLEKFLPSVVQFSEEATVYIADNASTDDSVSYIEQAFPSVNIIRNSKNWGFAKGYNEALFSLDEELFILLNSDVEVTKDWLKPILSHFERHPDTALAQPKILDYKRQTHFEYAGAAGGFVDAFGYPFCRGRIFEVVEEDQGQYEDESPIFWASGACLAVRNTVYKELNGLDELYFAHQEEVDLCWRAHNLGYDVFYIPRSRIYHLGGATLDRMSPQKTFLNFRNSLFNLLKNVPGRKVYFILFMRLFLDGLAGVKFLFEGKLRHIWAVIKAHFSFYAHFRKVYGKRKTFRQGLKYASLHSIVWQYYVKKHRRYKDLPLPLESGSKSKFK